MLLLFLSSLSVVPSCPSAVTGCHNIRPLRKSITNTELMFYSVLNLALTVTLSSTPCCASGVGQIQLTYCHYVHCKSKCSLFIKVEVIFFRINKKVCKRQYSIEALKRTVTEYALMSGTVNLFSCEFCRPEAKFGSKMESYKSR